MAVIKWMLILVACSIGNSARGGFIVNATEVGNDVIISGGGTANLTDLDYAYTTSVGSKDGAGSVSVATWGHIFLGGPVSGHNVAVYQVLSGPTNFSSSGSNTTTFTTNGIGDFFGLNIRGDGLSVLVVDYDYVSGVLLSVINTYEGQSFATMGMAQGTYVWTWGSGANADSFTLNVGPAAVPEPSSLALFISVGIALAFYRGAIHLKHIIRFKSRGSWPVWSLTVGFERSYPA